MSDVDLWEPSALAAAVTRAAGVEATGSDATGTVCVDVPREAWTAALAHCRDGLGCDMLDWLSAVDEPDGDPPGVDVVVHLVATGSVPAGPLRRLLVRTRVPADDPVLPSVTSLWAGAAWHERETFEMFGVTFTGFADRSGGDLRPLLLPDGFEGTPLRKSFVLAARAAKPWPGAKEPGESGEGHASPSRRKVLPPGVPDPSWGPRRPRPPESDELHDASGTSSDATGSDATGPDATGEEPA